MVPQKYKMFWGTQVPYTNIPIKWSQKVAVARWCGADITGNFCPIPAQTYRCHHAGDPRIDAAVADNWCWGAEAEGQAIAGDGRCLTQGAAEYERV